MGRAYTVRSITIAEVLAQDGERYITLETYGDPSTWDQLGLLDYAATAVRTQVAFPEDADEETP